MTDPRVDSQAIREASYVDIPVIALCVTDAPLQFVDVAIPTNKARRSISSICWLLACEALRLRGMIPRTSDGWNAIADMFFYRDPMKSRSSNRSRRRARPLWLGKLWRRLRRNGTSLLLLQVRHLSPNSCL